MRITRKVGEPGSDAKTRMDFHSYPRDFLSTRKKFNPM